MAHAHGDATRAGPLRVALVVTLAIALLECAGGYAAHSIALLADSAHVFMDAVALAIAVAARAQVRRPATDRQSFGYARFEVLAALVNGGLLLAVVIVVAIEAVRRFAAPQAPAGGLMAGIAAVGFVANVVLGFGLARGARRDLNVKAALYHVAGDAVGAGAVALGGLVVLATHARWVDPALSLAVAALITVGVVRVVREATDGLLESAPAHAQIPAVRVEMQALPGVVDVHDLHIWTIGSGSHVLTAHVLLADARISDASALLKALESRLRDGFAIDHVTIQFECVACDADDRIVCTQTGRGPEF
ncbi:MAG: cation diffusion facilitator family transporter [Vulcanimicrobiaceae bacterium]